MFVSHTKKLAFIHVRKTGGHSLRPMLRQVTDMRNEGPYHETAPAARRRMGADWDGYYSFAFVRNPWDRLVSLWAARKKWVLPAPGAFLSFDEFVERKCYTETQASVLCERGRFLVEGLYRMDSCVGFEMECRRLWKRLGIAEVPVLHKNASRHAPYQTYYTPTTRKLVGEMFAADVELFGYTFEPV